MIVLFVSECEKAAWKRSRRILSRYAVQIGRRTWLARISEEGLRNIRHELTQAASRHTAIACHRVKTRYQTELAWIVGSRRYFSRTGEFAFSHSAVQLPNVQEETAPALRLLNHLCILAGLFHDLGKHTACFQHKLREPAANQSDPVRHERVSVMLFLRLLTLLTSSDSAPPTLLPVQRKRGRRTSAPPNTSSVSLVTLKDEQWLQSLTDSKKIYEALEKLWNEKPDQDWETVKPVHSTLLRPAWSSTEGDEGSELSPLLSVLCFLVISHHKLPDGKEDDFAPLEKTYINKPEALIDGLRLSTDHKSAWLQSPKWVNDIVKHARRARYLLQEHQLPIQDRALWYSAARYLARCALVLADHSVSSRAKTAPPVNTDSTHSQVCFANSWQGQLRQTLADHLEQVGQLSGRALKHLYQLQHNRNANVIETSPLQLTVPISEPTFAWQEKAEQKLLQNLRTAGEANDGFFALVMAETGSGKTRGNARILAAANGHRNYRLTVALGLRTLTLQTGDEFRSDLGFDNTPDAANEQCAVMVGGALTIALHELKDAPEPEAESTSPAQQAELAGIESSNLDDQLYQGISGEFDYDPDAPWPEKLQAPNNPKLNRLLQVPMLICTIDHLMPFLQSQRASAAVLGFRLSGTDLIIDEIDSFSTDDLPALLKLAYVVGLNGRKLLLSSATLPPATARAFFRSYRTGFNRWQQLQGVKPGAIRCGWISHHAAHIKFIHVSNDKAFAQQHHRFTQALLKTLQQQTVRRRLGAVTVPIMDTTANAYREVMQHCVELHRQWSNRDPETGIQYSIGCVRWSNVAHTRGFASHWLQQKFDSDNIQLKLICYHAKHLPLIRHRIEQVLNGLLKHKVGVKPHEHPTLRAHLDECKQQGKTDLLVVVSTSPVSEVGRDHDYDWGIVEPNSYWSLIQMAGRIWRHRHERKADQPNMLMMSQTMRALRGDTMRFTKPGPESKKFRLYNSTASKLAVVFDLEGLKSCIDARFTLHEPTIQAEKSDNCYQYPDMCQLEHGQLNILLENAVQQASAMYFVEGTEPLMFLTQKHSLCCPFRQGIKSDLIWYDEEDETWKYLENEKNASTKNINCHVKKQNSFKYLDQSYFNPHELERKKLYEQWRSQLALRGLDDFRIVNALSLSIGDNLSNGKSLEYSDFIGWLIASADKKRSI